MKYFILSSDGNQAEAESLEGAMCAAWCLFTDVGGGTFIRSVWVDSRQAPWAVKALHEHVAEKKLEVILKP